mmetsp:Transcript_23210/g.40857  ORF Transcript_23210/g.40857 Transcript_23210/m.40857 type:complete len:196 (+) Transcript_23210:52-639(+)
MGNCDCTGRDVASPHLLQAIQDHPPPAEAAKGEHVMLSIGRSEERYNQPVATLTWSLGAGDVYVKSVRNVKLLTLAEPLFRVDECDGLLKAAGCTGAHIKVKSANVCYFYHCVESVIEVEKAEVVVVEECGSGTDLTVQQGEIRVVECGKLTVNHTRRAPLRAWNKEHHIFLGGAEARAEIENARHQGGATVHAI